MSLLIQCIWIHGWHTHSYHLNSSLALLLPSSVNSISVSPANPYPDLRLPAIPNGGAEYRDYWDNI